MRSLTTSGRPMTVVIYFPAGATITVPDITAVERRAQEIVCLRGATLIATYHHAEITAYALVPDPPADRGCDPPVYAHGGPP